MIKPLKERKREKFDLIFDKFIQEVSHFPLGNSDEGFESGSIETYFIEHKERFYRTIELAPNRLKSSQTGLEIGCGFFTAYMHALGIETSTTGKDLHIWKTWAEKKNIEAINHDVVDGLPFSDNSFDVIYFCEVMEHIVAYPNDYLSELYRVLKPGGDLILTTPNVHRLSNRVRALRGQNILDPMVRTYDGVNHIREFDAQELKDYLLLAGFTEPNVKTFNYYSSLKDKIVYKIFNFVSLRRLIIATSRK